MNERIKELALQAGYTTDMFGIGHWDMPECKRFAELIVAECLKKVEEEYKPVLEDKEMMKDTHWDGYVQCGVDSYVAIREHFK
jgi:hypothetical protein